MVALVLRVVIERLMNATLFTFDQKGLKNVHYFADDTQIYFSKSSDERISF